MQKIPKEIVALIKGGRLEVLRNGMYCPYEIVPKYGASPIKDDAIILIVKENPDIPNDNT